MATINSIGTKYPIEVLAGGTGESIMTQHAVAIGGVTDLDYLPIGVTGEMLIGNTAADPTWSNTITVTSVTISGLGSGVVQSSAAGLLSSSEGIDGQLLISSGAGAPTWSNITSTSGRLDVTNGANTIDIDTLEVLQSDTGFATWGGAGNYYDDTVIGDFELLRPGTGYIKGVPVSWLGAQTVTGLTSGNAYYIYVDDTGTIGKVATRTDAIYCDYIVLFQCWRDAKLPTNNQKTVKENHSYCFPVKTSNYLHKTVGSVIENYQNGANITLNGTQKIEISGADELDDHGLETVIADSGGVAETFAHLYTNAAGKWVVNAATDTFQGEYNNAGTVTALGANKYGVYTLYVGKDDLNTSVPRYGAIINTAQYNNLAAADLAISDGTVAISTNELSVMENCRLGYIVFSAASTSIVDVIIDKNTLRSSNSTSGTNQASLISTNITNFDGVLSAVDTNVQSSLDTIDEWGKTTTDHALLIGNGTGVAIGSLAVGATNQVLLGNTAADPTWGSVDLTTDITGILPIANGGTNASAMATTYGVNYFDGTRVVTTAVGTATHVLTSNGAGVAPTFAASSGGTVGSVTGGTNITDSGTATDPILDLDATITLTTVNAATFDTNIAAAAVTLTGTTLSADGTDANIDLNITSKGTGQVIIDDLQLTTALTVPYGGTGVATITDHGVIVGSAAAAVTPLVVGTDGQVLVGSSAADPVFATLSSTGTIALTPGAGTLALDCRAATDALTGVVELATDAESIAGTASTVTNCTSLKAKLGTQTSHGIAYGAGTTGAVAWTAEMTDGQLLLGDTGGVPIPATLTAGTGVSVTNAAGSVTVASTGTTLNNQTGTTYTLVLTDAGKHITFTNAAAIAVTVPTNAAVAFPIGTIISFSQGGAGQATFSGAVPPTLQSADTALTTVKIYSGGCMVKILTDTWRLFGDLEA